MKIKFVKVKSLLKKIRMKESINFNLAPRNPTEQFQYRCGECLVALERYKLKTLLSGCSMGQQEVVKYFDYYSQKPKKRLQFGRRAVEGLVRTYQRNEKYLQALELKTVNSMMKIYRKRMNPNMKEAADLLVSKFQKDEQMLNEIILKSDHGKVKEITNLLQKVKTAEQERVRDEEKNEEPREKKVRFTKALKAINQSETRYFRFFESWQRSIANMANQMSCHMQKLSEFYNLWQNLGSSMIYEMKSDREVFIDKTLEEKKGRGYSTLDEGEEEMMQVISVMPSNSKIRQQYEQKLENIKSKSLRAYSNNGNFTFSNTNSPGKYRRGNLKLLNQGISKMAWFETEAEDIKEFDFSKSMVLREKETGYFRYTYEELQHQTINYMVKNIHNDFETDKESYFDRFYVFCEKKARNKQESSEEKKQLSLGPPHMAFNCWFDRLGSKGVFNIEDLPTNLFQRKLQYESDRQVEMLNMDEKRRKEYNNKQSKLNGLADQSMFNIGYKQTNPLRETQKLRQHLMASYDLWNLPEFRAQGPTIVQQKDKTLPDFSDSQSEDKKKVAQKQGCLYQNFKIGSEKIGNRKSIRKQMKTIKELKKSYPWLQIKKNQKQVFQTFVESYLPQLEKMISHKMKADWKILGLTEDQMEKVSFGYLANFELDTIYKKSKGKPFERQEKKGAQQRGETESIGKVYLVNKHLYVKIEPLFFLNGKKVIKILVVLQSQMEQLQKLKQNLSTVYSPFGACKFNLNADFIAQTENADDKFFCLLGHLVGDLKANKNLKNLIIQSENSFQFELLVNEGKKVFEAYQVHYKRCRQLQSMEKV